MNKKIPDAIEQWTMPVQEAIATLDSLGLFNSPGFSKADMPISKEADTVVAMPYHHEKYLRISYRTKNTVTIAICSFQKFDLGGTKHEPLNLHYSPPARKPK